MAASAPAAAFKPPAPHSDLVPGMREKSKTVLPAASLVLDQVPLADRCTAHCAAVPKPLNHSPPLPSEAMLSSCTPDGTVIGTLLHWVPLKCSNCSFGPPPGAPITQTSVSDSARILLNCRPVRAAPVLCCQVVPL